MLPKEAQPCRNSKAMNRTIFLTETDKQKLDSLLLTVRAPSSGDSLEEELARAEVVPSEQIPPDVVTMNSRVRFKDESAGKELVVTLVYPADADASTGRVSVLAPIGSALLGLSVGESVEWQLPNGRTKTLRIEEVLYQPEAAGDFHL
jgi:regulator of nucleoside diphosphate kinase